MILPASSSSWEPHAFLGLGPHPFNLCPCPHLASPSVFKSFSFLMKTLVNGFGATLIQDDLILRFFT